MRFSNQRNPSYEENLSTLGRKRLARFIIGIKGASTDFDKKAKHPFVILDSLKSLKTEDGEMFGYVLKHESMEHVFANIVNHSSYWVIH